MDAVYIYNLPGKACSVLYDLVGIQCLDPNMKSLFHED